LKFRPCIDLRGGRVVQIVGGTLQQEKIDNIVTNFESDQDASAYARLYQTDDLTGGHVISLGDGNQQQAISALGAFPGGLQYGGGVTDQNAVAYLEAGASHVIVTSWIFHQGEIDYARLEKLFGMIGKQRLVIDLSCRKRDGEYWVVMDRWQTFTQAKIDYETLSRLSDYCDEFLVHGVDVEGQQVGVEYQLVEKLADIVSIPVTYAGGVKQLAELDNVHAKGKGKIDLTIGSALDIFGGDIKYSEVVAWQRSQDSSAI
jgi:phosphoribosylformimino-5-aminoimidazole carboxamide ribotide isomerase